MVNVSKLGDVDLHYTSLESLDANLPTLRGVLTTSDGAKVWVELDGIAILRSEDHASVFLTSGTDG